MSYPGGPLFPQIDRAHGDRFPAAPAQSDVDECRALLGNERSLLSVWIALGWDSELMRWRDEEANQG